MVANQKPIPVVMENGYDLKPMCVYINKYIYIYIQGNRQKYRNVLLFLECTFLSFGGLLYMYVYIYIHQSCAKHLPTGMRIKVELWEGLSIVAGS